MNAPLVDIHTHHPARPAVVSVYAYEALSGAPLPMVPYSTGIHPWVTYTLEEENTPRETLLRSITPLTVAIGEIGLDYHIAREPLSRRRQERWLCWQLEVAERRCLPVIIHCVKAYNPLLKILNDYPVRAIIHGFTGSAQLAGQLLSCGCYLSYGKNLDRSPKTREALGVTPPDRLFLETDTEEGLSLESLYDRAADLLQLPLETLREAIYDNYKRIFNRHEP